MLEAFFAGTLFYTLMTFIGGSDGVWAQKQLQEQKQLLSSRTTDIEKTNDELSLEKIALQKDLDVIAAFAKKLGYVSEHEKLVKISGLAPHETHVFDPGTALLHEDAKAIPEWLCKASAFVIGVLFYLVLLLFDLQGSPHKHFPFEKKFPSSTHGAVYDIH